MVHLAPAWHLEVERGPGCLIVRLEPPQDPLHNWDGLAEHLWSLLEEQFTYRVVLDMQHVAMMNSTLIGQLIMLHKRVHAHSGMLRLCGLSEDSQQVLKACRMQDRFPSYANCEHAMLGRRSPRPR